MKRFIAFVGFALTISLSTEARVYERTLVQDEPTFIIHSYDQHFADTAVAIVPSAPSVVLYASNYCFSNEGSGYSFSDGIVVDFCVDYIHRQGYRIEGATKLPNTYSNIKSKFLWLINCSIKQC